MRICHQPTQLYHTTHPLFITTHYENTHDYNIDFTQYKIPQYIIKKRNKNHTHDAYLYRRWTKPNHTTKTRTKHQASTPHHNQESFYNQHKFLSARNASMPVTITIWNHPSVQYRKQKQHNTAPTRSRPQ